MLKRIIWKLAIGVVATVLSILLISGFLARDYSELEPWHINEPVGEFRANKAGADYDFADYRRDEESLFISLSQQYLNAERAKAYSPIVRYIEAGINNPANFPVNWNRTTEIVPKTSKGSVLLLHGLSDSPYSMRAIGEIFERKGFYVLHLRLPGHGTTPAALMNVSWKDWLAAVKLAADRAIEMKGQGPFFIGGYSNGGSLALAYTIEALLTKREVPNALFLFSPAVGVTTFSRFAHWHKVLSWIPYFRKSQWHPVLPEIDPYKYNSFPKTAGRQSWKLSRKVQDQLADLLSANLLDELPPVLTFQSAIDSTVLGDAVIDTLYRKLRTPDSELVIFDVLQSSLLSKLQSIDLSEALSLLKASSDLPFHLTVFSNYKDKVTTYTYTKEPFSDVGEISETALNWPKDVYSLSHVAIPFSPEDQIYGDGTGYNNEHPVTLGNLALRGEKQLLLLSPEFLMRLRYNPFFSYMEARIENWIQRYEQSNA